MAAKPKGQEDKQYFVYNYVSLLVDSIQRLCEKLARFMAQVLVALSPIWNLFIVVYAGIGSVFQSLTNTVKSVIHCVKLAVHFEYRALIFSLMYQPKDYYLILKDELHNKLWTPVRRQAIRLRKQARKRLLDLRIYMRGFLELCRRLFLLTSDFVPGGKFTVGISLVVLVVFLLFEFVHYSRLVFKLLNFLLSVVVFILNPVILTLQDVLSVILNIFTITATLLKSSLYILYQLFTVALGYVFKALVAVLSLVYKCGIWFFELKYVQLVWRSFFKFTSVTVEVFFLTVLPFIILVLIDAITNMCRISSYFYDKLATVNIETQKNDSGFQDFFSYTRIYNAICTLYCVVWAYRWRKSFPKDLCSEIEDVNSPSSPKVGSKIDYKASQRETKYGDRKSREGLSRRSAERGLEPNENKDEMANCVDPVRPTPVYIQISSMAHICPGFIRGKCSRGRRCDSHHCPLTYHWQYREPVGGWTSFTAHDNDKLEALYCDVSNEVVMTRDIDPDVSSATFLRRSTRFDGGPIRLEFLEMRMEVNYYRSDIRRLSTQSCGKRRDDRLDTRWTWYRLNEEGQWTKYGNDKETDVPNQERIEAAFCRRESSYNYKADGQDFRIYFFMKPMYERNMNPRQNQRRLVRRRPLFKSEDEIERDIKNR